VQRLRIFQRFGDRIDGAGGHAGAFQHRQDVQFAPVAQNFSNLPNRFGAMVQPSGIVGESWIGDPIVTL
jgi:hypothetical protein